MHNLLELLEQQASKDKETKKLHFLDDQLEIEASLSHHELLQRAKMIAAKLQTCTQKGDRVLLLYPPSLEFVSAFFGCLFAGVIAVPAYPPADKKLILKLQGIINNAEPKIILSTKAIVQQITQLKFVKSLKNVALLDHLITHFMTKTNDFTQWNFEKFTWMTSDDLPKKLSEQYQRISVAADDIAFLQYTSGSTGEPKGVMVTHANLLNNLALISTCYPAQKDTVIVEWLPPYHDMGLIGGILYPIYNGRPVYMMSPITFLHNPMSWLRAIDRYHGTASCAPNFAYALCTKKATVKNLQSLNLEKFDAVLNGAEPVSLKVMEDFIAKFAVCGLRDDIFLPCYGLAEATLMATGQKKINVQYFSKEKLKENIVTLVNKDSDDARGIVSCGQLLNGVTIVDPETRMVCEDNKVGEIWIANPCVAKGYWNREEETNLNFHATLEHQFDKYYLRTGDLAFHFKNELFVMGRMKDLIIINGTNHHAHDIENSIAQCHPAIRSGNCAAVCVEKNEQERLAVILEIKPDHEHKDIDDIMHAIKTIVLEDHNLAVHTIALIPPKSLPKTTSGKIRRHAAKQALLDETLSAIAQWSSSQMDENVTKTKYNSAVEINEVISSFGKDLREKIRHELHDVSCVELDKISDDQSFAELGLDSLMAMELENRLQDHLKDVCQLDNAVVMNYPTIASLAAHIESRISSNQREEK